MAGLDYRSADNRRHERGPVLRKLFGPGKAEIWNLLARQIGGRVGQGDCHLGSAYEDDPKATVEEASEKGPRLPRPIGGARAESAILRVTGASVGRWKLSRAAFELWAEMNRCKFAQIAGFSAGIRQVARINSF